MQVENPDVAAATMPNAILTETVVEAPENTGQLVLGRTLYSLLEEACQSISNDKAFNQRDASGWQAMSNHEFKDKAENLALALDELGLQKGDRIAFFTHSDLSFALPDMACMMIGLVNVPLYLTHNHKALKHIINESEASTLIISDETLLKNIQPLLTETPSIKNIILWQQNSQTLELAANLNVYSYQDLIAKGKELKEKNKETLELLKASVKASDLATLIYTSGTTGLPKGVMLSQENISSNVIASFTGMPSMQKGQEETALAFLPLTHIFARTLQYGLIWYGVSTYYSDPDSLREHLQEVKPTYFASVPRVLEKAYERILATGASLTGIKKTLFDWAMDLAGKYDVSKEATGMYALQLKLADKLIFSKWREALGGRIKHMSVGGAALHPDLVNSFGAAKIDILQGYGLTETSPVISFNRPGRNRAGTVGEILTGVEVKLSSEGEILAKGPNIMQGYYKNPEKTAEVLKDGWFYTGDLGAIEDGYLKITGRIKNLFKLSTGKYVMPQPLEERLESNPMIANALVVGESQKFCAVLLFVSPETFGSTDIRKLEESEVDDNLQALLQDANKDLPHWSTIKKAAIILEDLSIENGMLTPKMSVKRTVVLDAYKAYVDSIFGQSQSLDKGIILDI